MFKNILILASFILFAGTAHPENYAPNSASPIIAEAKISSGDKITLTSPDLDVTAARVATKDGWKIRLSGTSKGKPIFTTNYVFKNANDYESSIKLVKLSHDSEYPQILFDGYSGGAHCCTWTEILFATRDGKWQIADFGFRDGDRIGFEDIIGTGNFVVVGVDDSFNYRFDCYACSRPPIKIEEFKNGRLNDVTHEPRFRDRLKYELQRIEADPSANWNSNGFLAGWAALKSLLGEQKDAFRRLLPLYDRNNQFGIIECSVAASPGKCPADKQQFIPFPEGLKKFLVMQKYLTPNQADGIIFEDSKSPQKETFPDEAPSKQKLDPGHLIPEPKLNSDAPISSLSKREICRYAVINTLLGNVPAAWDDRPAYSEYLNEAKSRGYSLENCVQALRQ